MSKQQEPNVDPSDLPDDGGVEVEYGGGGSYWPLLLPILLCVLLIITHTP